MDDSRSDDAGPIDHFRGSSTPSLTAPFFIGIPVLIVAGIWFIYRIVKGWLRLSESKPMYV